MVMQRSPFAGNWVVYLAHLMAPKLVHLRSANDAFQHAHALSRNRARRQKHRKFFVEGVKTIQQAMSHSWKVDAVYYAGDVELSSFAVKVLERSTARMHYELPTRLFEPLRWSSKHGKRSELIALIEMQRDDISRIPVDEHSVVVVFDRPSSHGNLGTVIRTCEVFGSSGLVITGHAVDLYDPQTVRASMGSLFSLPIVRLPSHREVRAWAEGVRRRYGGFRVVGSSARGAIDVRGYGFEGPVALVIGNETHGLSMSYLKACDDIVRIPTRGEASSLNVASAAAILLYEFERQRETNQEPHSQDEYAP